ncbi:MAG: DUF4296 domain-containing protein [Chitinophagales bacterium]|nr:DUF4296 domain-containing protein [Chitinophagales bacterium]
MRTLFLFLIIVSAIACGREEAPLPLTEDKLVAVIVDAHIAEAALQNLRGDLKDSMATIYYEQICTIHNIEKADFDSSMALLRERPEEIERIYREAMNEIDRRAAEKKSN